MYRTEPDMGNTKPRIRVPGEAGFSESIRRHFGTCDRCRKEPARHRSCESYRAIYDDIERSRTPVLGVETMRDVVNGGLR